MHKGSFLLKALGALILLNSLPISGMHPMVRGCIKSRLHYGRYRSLQKKLLESSKKPLKKNELSPAKMVVLGLGAGVIATVPIFCIVLLQDICWSICQKAEGKKN